MLHYADGHGRPLPGSEPEARCHSLADALHAMDVESLVYDICTPANWDHPLYLAIVDGNGISVVTSISVGGYTGDGYPQAYLVLPDSGSNNVVMEG